MFQADRNLVQARAKMSLLIICRAQPRLVMTKPLAPLQTSQGGTSRWSISCGIIVTNKQSENLIIMKSEKEKNDGRERTKKGGRSVKGAAEK